MDYMDLGSIPISEDSPAGSDCRYEETFESLQAEIDKLSSPSASGKVDWEKIVKASADILKHQSKDLTVASYLAVGLVHHQQVEGLDLGIQILRDMVETYWDNLFPPKKRMRGRIGAFNWWLEKTEEALQKVNASAIPADQADRMQTNLKLLDEHLVDKMADPPLLRPVQRQIEAIPIQKQVEPEKEDPGPQAAPAASEDRSTPSTAPAPEPQPVADLPAAIDSDKDAQKTIGSALQRIRQASLWLLQQNLADPLPYRYRRLASWAPLNSLPPNSDGATQIPAPPPQVVSELEGLREVGNWPGLIQNCEQKMSQYIFWFDLHRMVAEGLKKLGAEHGKALQEVGRETAFLLQRLPGLDELSFADGTPFADPQTRKWLKTIGLGEGLVAEADGALQDAQEEIFDTQIQKALGLARKKRLADGISLLQDQMQQTPSHQNKLRWRLAIIQVLLALKKSQLALPHTEQVLSDIDAFNVEQWDPPLALEGLSAAWKVFNAQTGNDSKKRAADLIGRIAAGFPAEALRLK